MDRLALPRRIYANDTIKVMMIVYLLWLNCCFKKSNPSTLRQLAFMNFLFAFYLKCATDMKLLARPLLYLLSAFLQFYSLINYPETVVGLFTLWACGRAGGAGLGA